MLLDPISTWVYVYQCVTIASDSTVITGFFLLWVILVVFCWFFSLRRS